MLHKKRGVTKGGKKHLTIPAVPSCPSSGAPPSAYSVFPIFFSRIFLFLAFLLISFFTFVLFFAFFFSFFCRVFVIVSNRICFLRFTEAWSWIKKKTPRKCHWICVLSSLDWPVPNISANLSIRAALLVALGCWVCFRCLLPFVPDLLRWFWFCSLLC